MIQLIFQAPQVNNFGNLIVTTDLLDTNSAHFTKIGGIEEVQHTKEAFDYLGELLGYDITKMDQTLNLDELIGELNRISAPVMLYVVSANKKLLVYDGIYGYADALGGNYLTGF